MRNDEIEVIKRKIFLESKIRELKIEYPNYKEFDYEQAMSFIADKMNKERCECLSYNDWQYFNKAYFLSIDEINEELIKYDNSHPKMDELRFVNTLSRKYNVDIDTIISRIKEIRQIIKFEKKINNESNCLCGSFFVVTTTRSLNENTDNKPKGKIKIRINKH